MLGTSVGLPWGGGSLGWRPVVRPGQGLGVQGEGTRSLGGRAHAGGLGLWDAQGAALRCSAVLTNVGCVAHEGQSQVVGSARPPRLWYNGHK